MDSWDRSHQGMTTRNGPGWMPHLASRGPTASDDNMGFSHGAFNLNQAGFAHRHPRRANVPTINTGSARSSVTDMATPGTALDMQFTPLLPSQLLLGSPFQPGSPPTFASPPFSAVAPSRQGQVTGGSATQSFQAPLSPEQMNDFFPSATRDASQMVNPQSPVSGIFGLAGQGIGFPPTSVMPAAASGTTSRTVYLGNIPSETSAEEILGHVRSGPIESVRLLPDKNCAFISFLDASSATHFHSDAILKRLSVRGHDIKVGWGKPSHLPTSVAIAVQQSGASRNVYLGNLPPDITEQEVRDDLGKFGPIDIVKLVKEKNIGFVHFLSIGNAIKAVTNLPQESKWQAPRRVYYGKDRCAYVSKTQQQNAAQYLGIAPGYAHVLNGADRDLISNTIAQQSVAAAAVATAAGGMANLGNRTVYLGNIHPETTIEEICNVVRGGLLHHVRFIADKHICFVTFVDPTSAASFYALSQMQGLMIHNRRLKIGWGKHSGALPPAIALAVSGGASRNVYVGNLDESWTEDRLRQDFSDHGEIELVNTLREKSCAFVNFTNIANAIKAIEAVRGREDYRRFKINFGKDRCGNPPRQGPGPRSRDQHAPTANGGVHDRMASPHPLGGRRPTSSRAASANSPTRAEPSPPSASTGAASNHSPPHSLAAPHSAAMLHPPENNPLTVYLSQLSMQRQGQQPVHHVQLPETPFFSSTTQHSSQQQMLAGPQMTLSDASSADFLGGDVGQTFADAGGNPLKTSSSAWTIGGLLAPSNARGQHARAISLPLLSQDPSPGASNPRVSSHLPNINSVTSAHVGGFGNGSYGLAIQSSPGLPGWPEEEVAAQ